MTPVKNKGINDSAFYAIELIIVKLKTSKCQQTIFQNNKEKVQILIIKYPSVVIFRLGFFKG